MNNKPGKLNIYSFGAADPLHNLPETPQVIYLSEYLADLNAKTVLEEPNYFDRDFLSEFSAFYGISTKGYPNTCRRLHFFSQKITRESLRKAVEGSARALTRLESNYLGFIVIRPIEAAPLGRTVVRWYPENRPHTPRVTEPAREYHVHLAGLTLSVTGLAWQQQDTGVGACATIGLWSMLHSSAFDDHHAIPTTTEITVAAHASASLGSRVFPSTGLTIYQVCEAIKMNRLAPMIFEGDKKNVEGRIVGFSKDRFSSSVASLIRSGYPVLMNGILGPLGHHANCVVGFRSCSPSPVKSSVKVKLADSDIEYVYVHDDNIGPNIRFRISVNADDTVVLSRDVPKPLQPDHVRKPETPYHEFIPLQLLVAVHDDLRTSPDQLHRCGLERAIPIHHVLGALLKATGGKALPLSLSTRFIKLKDYVDGELKRTLNANPRVLGKVRLSLWEKVPPMSLHVSVLRIGLSDSTPLIDILFDTTDSDINHPVFCHVMYNHAMGSVVKSLASIGFDYGVPIVAY
jgi:hypothetical protein